MSCTIRVSPKQENILEFDGKFVYGEPSRVYIKYGNSPLSFPISMYVLEQFRDIIYEAKTDSVWYASKEYDCKVTFHFNRDNDQITILLANNNGVETLYTTCDNFLNTIETFITDFYDFEEFEI